METELKLDFCGAEPTKALQRFIAEHVGALEQKFGRLIECHVSVRAPSQRHRTGGIYEINIHLVLPGGREVAVRHTRHADERHADVFYAINDAFRRAKRQMQDRVRRMQRRGKTHEPQPLGTVQSFNAKDGYGFIRSADGHELYFHKNSVVDGRLSQLIPGTKVSFVESMGEKGLQASTVHLLGKHGMR